MVHDAWLRENPCLDNLCVCVCLLGCVNMSLSIKTKNVRTEQEKAAEKCEEEIFFSCIMFELRAEEKRKREKKSVSILFMFAHMQAR